MLFMLVILLPATMFLSIVFSGSMGIKNGNSRVTICINYNGVINIREVKMQIYNTCRISGIKINYVVIECNKIKVGVRYKDSVRIKEVLKGII